MLGSVYSKLISTDVFYMPFKKDKINSKLLLSSYFRLANWFKEHLVVLPQQGLTL